ncbi:MAG: hypothetical protein ACK5VX_11620 [Akkermansiaceae bacterium]
MEAALSLEKMSNDPESPIYSFYGRLLACIDSKYQNIGSSLNEKIATSETREKQLAAQLATAHTENLKAIDQGFQKHTGETFWKRVRNLQLSSIALWIVLLATSGLLGSYLIYNHQLTDLKKINQRQKEVLETITNEPAALVAYSRFSLDVHKEANRSIPTIAGIAAMLKLPQSTLGIRNDQLGIAVSSADVSIEVKNGRTYISFINNLPELSGTGYTGMIENLDKAEKARGMISPK